MSDSQGDGLEVEVSGDVIVVGFRPQQALGEPTIRRLGDELSSLVDKKGCTKVVVNLGNVECLSSAVLGTLVLLHKKMAAARGRLTLKNLAPEIRKVFEITRLDKMFGLSPDHGEDGSGGATARLKPPKPSGGAAVSLKPPPDGQG